MTEIRHRVVETNGIRMHVAEAGEGPLVIMCHGFPESWYSWRHQLVALAEAGYHAVAPDMRGYGQTDQPEPMEAATWNGTNILRTSAKLALRTEASTRFEKQLHPELALRAQNLAARLMVELCGARLAPGTIDVAAPVPPPRRVTLRSARLESLLGERIEPDESSAILTRPFAARSSGARATRHDRPPRSGAATSEWCGAAMASSARMKRPRRCRRGSPRPTSTSTRMSSSAAAFAAG